MKLVEFEIGFVQINPEIENREPFLGSVGTLAPGHGSDSGCMRGQPVNMIYEDLPKKKNENETCVNKKMVMALSRRQIHSGIDCDRCHSQHNKIWRDRCISKSGF